MHQSLRILFLLCLCPCWLSFEKDLKSFLTIRCCCFHFPVILRTLLVLPVLHIYPAQQCLIISKLAGRRQVRSVEGGSLLKVSTPVSHLHLQTDRWSLRHTCLSDLTAQTTVPVCIELSGLRKVPQFCDSQSLAAAACFHCVPSVRHSYAISGQALRNLGVSQHH